MATEVLQIKSGADLIDFADALTDGLNREKENQVLKNDFNAVGTVEIVDDPDTDNISASTPSDTPSVQPPIEEGLEGSSNPAISPPASTGYSAESQALLWEGIIKGIDSASREGAALVFGLMSAKDYARCTRIRKSLVARLGELNETEQLIFKYCEQWLSVHEESEKVLRNGGMTREEIAEATKLAVQIAKSQNVEINPWIGLISIMVVPIGMNMVSAVRMANSPFEPAVYLHNNKKK